MESQFFNLDPQFLQPSEDLIKHPSTISLAQDFIYLQIFKKFSDWYFFPSLWTFISICLKAVKYWLIHKNTPTQYCLIELLTHFTFPINRLHILVTWPLSVNRAILPHWTLYYREMSLDLVTMTTGQISPSFLIIRFA